MKSLLKVSAAVMMLAVMAVAMVIFFGSMERSRGQLPAASPTPVPPLTPQATLPLLTNPVITPVVSSTPRPVPSVIIDPTWSPPTPTPLAPLPAASPLPATGGPYVSEQEAIAIALRGARATGEADTSVAPRAVFTTAENVRAVLDKLDRAPKIESQRETWVVFTQGRFPLPSAPRPLPEKVYFREHVAIIDATTGNIDAWGLRNRLP